jgi:hypothetical protein
MITSNVFIELIKNTFSDTKYKKWYVSLIFRALDRVDYTKPSHKKQALSHLDTVERHHICPVSLFPDHKTNKNNLAYLSPKEHFLAHLLLYKMAKQDSKFVRPLALAVSKMRQKNNNQSRVMNSNRYGFIRRAAIDANKHRQYKTGYKQSPETILKRVTSYHKNYKGHSFETRQKISQSAKERKEISFETRSKMSKSHKGKPSPMKGKSHNKKTKQLISQKLSGKNHPLYGKSRSTDTKNKLRNARLGKYTGSNNGMFGVKHQATSILLMKINKIKHNIKNIDYDLNLETWQKFIDDVKEYAAEHTKKDTCKYFGISLYILSSINK